MLGYGKATFLSSSAAAERLFAAGNTFSNRLGATAGLHCLGMDRQGVIWNNNVKHWEHCGKYFAKAVQEGATQPRNLPNTASVCLASFAITQQQLVDATASGMQAGTHSDLQFTYDPMRQESQTILTLEPLQFMRCCTFRIICALSFGLPVDAFSLPETQSFVASINGFFKAWEYFLMRPWWLMPRNSTRAKHEAAIKKLNDVIAIIDKAKALLEQQPQDCFLSRLLRDRQAGLLSAPQGTQLVLEMLLAGTDTSSVTMFYLLKACQDDPSLEQCLREEVATHIGGREVCHGDLVHLEKITAALNESMRFKPVGPVAIRQATKELSIPPATLNGCPFGLNFKRGDSAIVHLEGMHRDPNVFAHPDQFDISHFLGDNAHLANSPSFRPFGHGRKGCVGKQLAWLEMISLMACWFKTFTFSRQQGNTATESLAEMPTHWEVANQPTSVTLFHVQYRPPRFTTRNPRINRICVIGAHGVGKSTLVNALKDDQALGQFQVISEVARQVLQATCMTRDYLQRDQAAFLYFQKLVLVSQMGAEMRAGQSSILLDRSIFDPLAYTSWRCGIDSKQVQDLLALPGVSDVIQQCRSASCIVLLVEPWSQPGHAAQDDGVRMLTDLYELHVAYKQLLDMINVAYSTVTTGPVQARVSQVLAVLAGRR